MAYSQHLPSAHIDLEKIAKNYRRLLTHSAAARAAPENAVSFTKTLPPGFGAGADGVFTWPSQMAVIKADAYGHGHIQVASTLMAEGCTMFASGSVQETMALRLGLEDMRADNRLPFARPVLLSLLGIVGPEDVQNCVEHGLVPVVHSFEQLALCERLEAPLPVALKCNTGMSRLGFDEAEISALIERLAKTPRILPVILLSHLHSADTGQGKEHTRVQAAVFARILGLLRERWPQLAASLGNSAGTLLADHIAAHIGPHICRPGIALYGGNPFFGTGLAALGQDLTPAMRVRAPIIAERELAPGAGVGYGHTFTAPKKMRIGIIAAGYADCFSRGLSNKGAVCVQGVRAPIVGRISMQMTAINLDALPKVARETAPAAPAWILGGPHPNAVSLEELAQSWGTITYEVLCLLGCNERVYGPHQPE